MSGQKVSTEKLKSWFIRFHRIMKSLREEISDCEILLNFLLLDYFLQFLTQLFHLTAPGDLKRSKIIRKLQDFWEKTLRFPVAMVPIEIQYWKFQNFESNWNPNVETHCTSDREDYLANFKVLKDILKLSMERLAKIIERLSAQSCM